MMPIPEQREHLERLARAINFDLGFIKQKQGEPDFIHLLVADSGLEVVCVKAGEYDVWRQVPRQEVIPGKVYSETEPAKFNLSLKEAVAFIESKIDRSKDYPEDLAKIYADALERPGTTIPLGRTVVCDICNADWTDRTESGGLLVGTYAHCPDCAYEERKDRMKYGDIASESVVHECPPGKSFADWVREMRGPEAGITISTGEKPETLPGGWTERIRFGDDGPRLYVQDQPNYDGIFDGPHAMWELIIVWEK